MKRDKSRLFWHFVLMLGLGLSASQVSAQQSPVLLATAQAQAAQAGQQPAQQQQPSQQQPGQPTQQPGQQPEPPMQQTPGSQPGQTQGVQTFTGMIVKSGDKYVLQDEATGTAYDIDHQDEVAQHVGKRVRVNGTLDPSGKMIHVQPAGR